MEKQILHFPRWMTFLYIISAIALAPWLVILGQSLPTRQLAHHWDLAWVGFDSFMLILFILTVILSIKRTLWVCLSSISLATIMIIDAWFDVLTSKSGSTDQHYALLIAVFVELPLAAATAYQSFKLVNRLHIRLLNIAADQIEEIPNN